MSVHRPDPSAERDPFEVLGVARGCSPDDLARAYRALARRYHPDVNPDADAATQMRTINAAFARARSELAEGATAGPPARPAVKIVHWHDFHDHHYHAHPPVRRRDASGQWERLRWWAGGGAVLVVAAALVWALSAHFGSQPAAPAAHTQLAPGQQTSLTWPTLGRVVLAERTLTTLAPGLYLHDRPQWSSDGQYTALSVDDSATGRHHPQILIYRAAGFAPVAQFAGFAPRWSPRSDQLTLLSSADANAAPQLNMLDIVSGTQSTLEGSAGTHVEWSPDGSNIAFGGPAQHTLKVVALNTRQVQMLYVAPPGETIAPVGWLNDTTVLCLVQQAKDTQLVAAPLAGTGLIEISDLGIATTTPAVDPQTSQVLYVARANAQAPSHLLLYDDAGQTATLVDARGGFNDVGGWSADDHWLAYAAQDAHTRSSAICLLPLQVKSVAGWPASATKCIAVSGTASGLAWESALAGDHLSFTTTSGATSEVDQLTLNAGGTPSATLAGQAGRLSPPAIASTGQTHGPDSRMAMLLAGILAWFRRGRIAALWQPSGAAREALEDGATIAPLPLRIGIVSEALKWPPDEALKRIALAITQGMAAYGEVLAVGTRGQRPDAQPYPVRGLRTNRVFVSPHLWRLLADFKPNVVCYLPGSGLTTWSLVRALALLTGLGLFGQRPLLALVAIQPRRRGRLGRWLLAHMGQTLVLVQSLAARERLRRQGCANVHVLQAGVDLDAFTPATAQMRAALRQEYDIPADHFVVVHVGHLKRNRQLDDLITLARHLRQATVVVVGSTSTMADPHVVDRLRAAGIRVIHRYLPHVESIYQLADCYVFPVRDDQASAQLPLSVLEALACGVPVVTTRFGALPEYLPASEAIDYCDTPAELIAAVDARREHPIAPAQARGLALHYRWEAQIAFLARELRARLAQRSVPSRVARDVVSPQVPHNGDAETSAN